MSTTTPGHPARRLKRIPLAVAISLASLALIAIAFATIGTPESVQPVGAEVEKPARQSSAPWNVALGDAVVFAPVLGFKATAPAPNKIEPPRVAAKLESQLTSLRQLYRQRSESDPASSVV